MRLLVHDFAGHAFAAELSRALAGRGHTVLHAYCGGVASGKGAVARGPGDPATLSFVDVQPEHFERYSPLGRLRSELGYGRRLAEVTAGFGPEAVLSGNTPLLAQAWLWRAASHCGARRVFWLQDFLGRGTRTTLAGRSRLLGSTAGRLLERLEVELLRRSDAIVTITDDFSADLARLGCRQGSTVVENWAPLDEIPPRPKRNPWSEDQGLADRPVALYSGTLGLKHDPEHLVELASRLSPSPAVVVVVTEGRGREHLERRRAELGLANLRLLDFVDHEVLPDVIGAADVCLVLLEPDAGHFSVPSKTLSYLSAGRAVVGAIPADNLAARLIVRAEAGTVVRPGDRAGFAAEVVRVLDEPERARTTGAAAREYAEAAFDLSRIADTFEDVLSGR